MRNAQLGVNLKAPAPANQETPDPTQVHHRTVQKLLELWDSLTSFPFVKDGPVYPTLKVKKEILKHLPLAFTEVDQLSSWLPLSVHFTHFETFLSKKRLSDRSRCL